MVDDSWAARVRSRSGGADDDPGWADPKADEPGWGVRSSRRMISAATSAGFRPTATESVFSSGPGGSSVISCESNRVVGMKWSVRAASRCPIWSSTQRGARK